MRFPQTIMTFGIIFTDTVKINENRNQKRSSEWEKNRNY